MSRRRIRAERRAGELLRNMETNKGGAARNQKGQISGNSRKPPVDEPAKLADLVVTKTQLSRLTEAAKSISTTRTALSDGDGVAVTTVVGREAGIIGGVRDLKFKDDPFGQRAFDTVKNAAEGRVNTFDYIYPKPETCSKAIL